MKTVSLRRLWQFNSIFPIVVIIFPLKEIYIFFTKSISKYIERIILVLLLFFDLKTNNNNVELHHLAHLFLSTFLLFIYLFYFRI